MLLKKEEFRSIYGRSLSVIWFLDDCLRPTLHLNTIMKQFEKPLYCDLF